MVAMFGRRDNTKFLASDKKIGMVQTEYHCTWLTARQPHVLSCCHLSEGFHAKHNSEFFLSVEDTAPQNKKKKKSGSE